MIIEVGYYVNSLNLLIMHVPSQSVRKQVSHWRKTAALTSFIRWSHSGPVLTNFYLCLRRSPAFPTERQGFYRLIKRIHNAAGEQDGVGVNVTNEEYERSVHCECCQFLRGKAPGVKA